MRMTELFALVPPQRQPAMSNQVKQIILLLSEGGTRWPLLRREEYLASGADYTASDLSKVLPTDTPGYELSLGEDGIATAELREWFAYELDPLEPPSSTDSPDLVRQQLLKAVESLKKHTGPANTDQ
ncbi:uncharacterized protein PHACADRAFT_254328 [Phanerochaete carnosa HHB-10118-sp]|uniref:Uncharacterized protein n=1 Tax=Phanerochaete carnosa (strain HHB-10118-sp) TaxID=650164 RepID=K5WCH0_PHACS|nr:uncharacterized protein PHACADRAFT_254328 [Phanerochaete carnosa HHB-10118-sp]EKM56930.1 hypothetical protein PHACADRAFT_254328 [Phanerochaete carnosa HHB-10118-sp]